MSRTKKKKNFSIIKAVKANARERVGTPQTSFAIPSKKDKQTKHKETLSDLLDKD